MSIQLKEVLKRLDQQRFTLSVWQEVINHLSKTVSVGETQASEAIVAESCSATTVPEDVVQQVIDSIMEKEVNPLIQQIEAVENLTVEEETTNDEQTAEIGEEEGGTGSEKQSGKGKQAPQKPQRVRQVVRQSR